MTPEQQAAFIIAQAACMQAEIAAMQAHNWTLPPNHHGRYGHNEFMALIEKYDLHSNALISFFGR